MPDAPPPPPEPLREEAEAALAELAEQLPAALLDAHRGPLVRLFAASPFAAGAARARPELLASALEDPAAESLAPLAALDDDAAFAAALRRARLREALRIAHRDLNGLAPLAETLRDLSAFADAAVAAARDWHAARLADPPLDGDGAPLPLVVLGMGKLGGGELNFSSDIDLIFAYPDPPGDRELAQTRFIRLGQRLIRALDEVTADGFVFRVDMRLRPFGSSGALALPFSAMETYYQLHGREWERYALLKSRPLGPATPAAAELREALRPFVYRRYLDFRILEELRGMKAKMERHADQAHLRDDLKHGPGGIREAEFVVQSGQLVFGGREPALQRTGWHAGLAALVEAGHIRAAHAATLRAAYDCLRRAENRLQMTRDQQVHTLPEEAPERARLAFAMGHPDWASFRAELDAHRARLHEEFAGLMRAADAPAPPDPALQALLDAVDKTERRDEPEPDLAAALAGRGLAPAAAEEPAARLRGLLAGSLWRTQGANSRQFALRLLPQMVDCATTEEAPGRALSRLLGVLETLLHRPSHLALLTENPGALALLSALAAGSSWLHTQILQRPELIDDLLNPQALLAARDAAELRAMLAQALDAADDDLEARMNALRGFRHSQVLRVAACHVLRAKPISDVSDELTWIAEAVVARAWALALDEQVRRHGAPGCADAAGARREARCAVLAYGKFGGLELGFGSDLDLVFLHDSEGADERTDGARAVENEYFFTRVAQRFVHILETLTAAGALYRVDARLRPGGQSGRMVCSLRYLARYLDREAWTWEHQALARARCVAGAPQLAAAFEALRARTLGRKRDAAALQRQFTEMRRRMLDARRQEPDRFHLKADPGGITDLEFLVHYNVLLHAHDHPELAGVTATVMILDRLAARGLLEAADARFLRGCYHAYRDRAHALSLQEEEPLVDPADFAAERARVRELWDRTFPAA